MANWSNYMRNLGPAQVTRTWRSWSEDAATSKGDHMRKSHNPSALMSAYNATKKQGQQNGLWDGPRTDRALGYLMDGQAAEKWAEYLTTTEACSCPDSQYRMQTCKHSLALMIDQEHDAIMDAFRTA